MNCPACKGPMRSGVLDISRSTTGAIADLLTGDLGTMPQHLYFYPSGLDECVHLDTSRPAFRCTRCEAVVIAGTMPVPEKREPKREPPPPAPNPEACPACGAALAPDWPRCPGCDIALR